MSPFEATPIVLGVQRHPGVLAIRIDRNLFSSELSRPDAVQVVSFEGADFTGATDSWIGRHIELEDFREAASVRVVLYIDYFDDAIELNCSDLRESMSPYSSDDLTTKVVALARLATEYSDAWDQVSRELRDLRNVLGTELDKEIDRSLRKASFFATSHSERADALESHVGFLRTIRSRLEPGA